MKKYFVLFLYVVSLSLNASEPKNGLVFDLEGTLAATEWVWFKANDQLLKAHGIEITEEARAKLKTMPAGCGLLRSIELLQERFSKLNEATVPELIEEKKSWGQYNIENNDFQYYPGVESFLAAAQKRGLEKAIATNCSTVAVKIFKEKLNLARHFGEHIYNPDHVDKKAKPDPALYLYAVKQLGLAPESCIAFEDSPSGARAARDAGLYVVGYDSSNNSDLANYSNTIVTEWSALDLDDLVAQVSE